MARRGLASPLTQVGTNGGETTKVSGPALDPEGTNPVCGSSPLPAARILRCRMPASKRPVKTSPTPPSEDVAALVDPDHTDEDFLRDLEKATSDDARRKLGLPAAPDRGSTRT